MKKTVILISVIVLFILAMPLTIMLVGFCSPPHYGETYYGQLPHMFNRLNNTEGKKIVLIGNSAIAFGVRSDLLAEEFPGYSVVNFGLYGTIGTKTMMDLSRSNICEGDIVIMLPEIFPQSLSLYFSADEAWRAIDGNLSMLKYIDRDNAGEMAGGFVKYTSDKVSRPPHPGTVGQAEVYAQASFNDEDGTEVGYMTYQRKHNIMNGGYDATMIGSYDSTMLSDAFIEYLNEYNSFVKRKGATLYFGFTPTNELAIDIKDQSTEPDSFYTYLCNRLDFEVIGHPEDYILDYRWFYDNNVHMNSAGMYKYTNLLTDDIKLAIGDTTENKIVVPDAPDMPVVEIGEGNNKDADLFAYEKKSDAGGEYIVITDLLEKGSAKTEIIVPTDYGGVPVRELATSAFAGNNTISKITMPKTVGRIYDNSFSGCRRLTMLVLEHESILGINAGPEFLAGADNCYIYLKLGVSISGCEGGWVRYQNRIRYY